MADMADKTSKNEMSQEEQYFHEREAAARAELRAKLEANAKAAAAKGEIAKASGVTDETVVAHLHALGLEGDAAGILHLFPLVEVAWADGSVSDAERDAIMDIAQQHGIKPGSDAALTLAAMLEERPSRTLLDQILRVLRQVLESKGMQPDNLVAACLDVARASGGFLGMGDKVGKEEKALIEKLTQSLNADAASNTARRLAGE